MFHWLRSLLTPPAPDPICLHCGRPYSHHDTRYMRDCVMKKDL